MVVVQNLLSMLQVQIILGKMIPREFKHELDIIILYAVIRR